MNKRLLGSLTTILVLLMMAVPTFAAGGHGVTRAGADHYPFHHSADVLPAPPYGSIDIEGSSGKLIVNRPLGKSVKAAITANFNGLLPLHTYSVHIMNYACPGADGWSYDHYGCWTKVGTFSTDENGHGDYHLNIRAGDLGAGTYHLSVWINDTSPGLTLLVSDNFDLVID